MMLYLSNVPLIIAEELHKSIVSRDDGLLFRDCMQCLPCQLQWQYQQTFPVGVNEFNSVSPGVIIGGRGQYKHGLRKQIVLMN